VEKEKTKQPKVITKNKDAGTPLTVEVYHPGSVPTSYTDVLTDIPEKWRYNAGVIVIPREHKLMKKVNQDRIRAKVTVQ